MIDCTCAGEVLRLLPERAVYWARTRTLIIADAHFGKAASFRRLGVPVPAGTTAADLRRLDAAIDGTRAERLVILGDLLHSRAGRAEGTLELLANWCRARSSLEVVLTRGNHDLRAGDPPADWCMRLCDQLLEPPFLFRHEPSESEHYVVAGHLHPAVLLEGRDGSAVRMPCFLVGPRRAILPAFGRFTGARRLRPRADDAVYVLIGEEVIAVETI